MDISQVASAFSLNFAEISLDAGWYAKAIKWLRGDDPDQPFYGLLLYSLVLQKRPTTIIDVGTARGFSAVCMAKALLDAKLENSHIYTIDPIPHDKPISWHVQKQADTDPAMGTQLTRAELLKEFEPSLLDKITFLSDSSGQVLSEWNDGPIEFAFIDGDHSYQGVKTDIDAIVPHLSSDATLVFDDYGPIRDKHEYKKYLFSKVKYRGVYKVVKELVKNGGWVFHYPRTVDFDRLAILQRFLA